MDKLWSIADPIKFDPRRSVASCCNALSRAVLQTGLVTGIFAPVPTSPVTAVSQAREKKQAASLIFTRQQAWYVTQSAGGWCSLEWKCPQALGCRRFPNVFLNIRVSLFIDSGIVSILPTRAPFELPQLLQSFEIAVF
jgi:hypothetical protein